MFGGWGSRLSAYGFKVEVQGDSTGFELTLRVPEHLGIQVHTTGRGFSEGSGLQGLRRRWLGVYVKAWLKLRAYSTYGYAVVEEVKVALLLNSFCHRPRHQAPQQNEEPTSMRRLVLEFRLAHYGQFAKNRGP